jgi:hypothetical protein
MDRQVNCNLEQAHLKHRQVGELQITDMVPLARANGRDRRPLKFSACEPLDLHLQLILSEYANTLHQT